MFSKIHVFSRAPNTGASWKKLVDVAHIFANALMFVVSIRYFSNMNLSNQENDMHTCTAQMPPGKIVGGVFLSRNQLLWVEELAVGAGAHLVNHRRFLRFSWWWFCWRMQEHEHPSRSGLLSPWSALGNYGRIWDQSKNHVQYVYMYIYIYLCITCIVCIFIHVYNMYMYACIYMYASKLHRLYLYQFQLTLAQTQTYCQERKDISRKFSCTAGRLLQLPVISTVTSGRGGYSNIHQYLGYH